MGWIAIAFICVLVILIVVFNTSRRKGSVKGTRKPTVATKEPHPYIPEDIKDKDERTKRKRVSREAVSYGGGREGTRTPVKYDRQKRFEESIRTPFPDEWSPALPYLYEANRLEREGASQQKIQGILEQARKVDSNATSFYVTRWSIIKKVQNRNHE